MICTMSMIGKVLVCLVMAGCVFSQGRITSSVPSIGSLLQQGVRSTTAVDSVSDETLTTTPELPHDPFRFLILCAPGSNKRNTCEKCTKVTRDPNTYQMCCENTRGVRNWCEKFLNPSMWMKAVNSS